MQALSRNETRHGRTVIVALVGMAIALAVALGARPAGAAPGGRRSDQSLPRLQSPPQRPDRHRRLPGRDLHGQPRRPEPQLQIERRTLRPLPRGLGRQPAPAVESRRRRLGQGVLHPRLARRLLGRTDRQSQRRRQRHQPGPRHALPGDLHGQLDDADRDPSLHQRRLPDLPAAGLGPRLQPGIAPLHQIPRLRRQTALALEADEPDGDLLQAVEPDALRLPDRIAERLRPPLGGRPARSHFPALSRVTANAPEGCANRFALIGQVRGVSAKQTDGEAIAASLSEPRAFGVVFERHFGAILRYLRRRLDDRHAEEATAQTFFLAFDSRARFDPGHASARPVALRHRHQRRPPPPPPRGARAAGDRRARRRRALR